jgi:hypothetical protein
MSKWIMLPILLLSSLKTIPEILFSGRPGKKNVNG